MVVHVSAPSGRFVLCVLFQLESASSAGIASSIVPPTMGPNMKTAIRMSDPMAAPMMGDIRLSLFAILFCFTLLAKTFARNLYKYYHQ